MGSNGNGFYTAVCFFFPERVLVNLDGIRDMMQEAAGFVASNTKQQEVLQLHTNAVG